MINWLRFFTKKVGKSWQKTHKKGLAFLVGEAEEREGEVEQGLICFLFLLFDLVRKRENREA